MKHRNRIRIISQHILTSLLNPFILLVNNLLKKNMVSAFLCCICWLMPLHPGLLIFDAIWKSHFWGPRSYYCYELFSLPNFLCQIFFVDGLGFLLVCSLAIALLRLLINCYKPVNAKNISVLLPILIRKCILCMWAFLAIFCFPLIQWMVQLSCSFGHLVKLSSTIFYYLVKSSYTIFYSKCFYPLDLFELFVYYAPGAKL